MFLLFTRHFSPISFLKFLLKQFYRFKDRQYSVQAITDSLGNIVESYSYNSFGILTMKNSSSNVILKSNVNNSITYTGRSYDSESDLYYYRNRMYSPSLGRFISQDPKGYIDGMNLYAYV
jgi:RHS repeat-associated protein